MEAAEIAEVVQRAELAEFHAHSVRQLLAQRDRLMAAFDLLGKVKLEAGALDLIARCIRESPAQFSQDVYAAIFAGGKRDGFFVEFGACDGMVISNTRTLESLGWRGILAEPLPKWHDTLRANRNCIIDTRCVWSSSGETLRLSTTGDDTQATVKVPAAAAHEVETISLNDLLREHDAPDLIDFMSVDVEGAEPDVLNAFDFGYRIGFLAVETHAGTVGSMEGLLARNGYKRVLAEVSGHDSFFVPI